MTKSALTTSLVLIGLAACAPRHPDRLISTDELGLRRIALHRVLPSYPTLSVRRRSSGPVVLSLRVAPDGTVTDASALQAPDSGLAEAAIDAAKQWRFRPPTVDRDGEHLPAFLDSKLTFYFGLDEAGNGEVTEPTSRGPSSGSNDSQSSRRAQVPRLGVRAVQELSRTRSVYLVDIRRRSLFAASHHDGALNIPLDELIVRRAELARAETVVIDCYSGMETVCQFAAEQLLRQDRRADVRIQEGRF